MDTELWQAVGDRVASGDIEGAERFLEEQLSAEPGDRFKRLIGARFTNQPTEILATVSEFIRECGQSFEVQAVYLEMNGFDINWGRWYFDLFAYSVYGDDPDDLEWLCDWESPVWPDVTLTGLEEIQADFQNYHETSAWRDPANKKAAEVANLLVMVKFVALIKEAIASGPLTKPVPVLATAHDFEIFGRFNAPKGRADAR